MMKKALSHNKYSRFLKTLNLSSIVFVLLCMVLITPAVAVELPDGWKYMVESPGYGTEGGIDWKYVDDNSDGKGTLYISPNTSSDNPGVMPDFNLIWDAKPNTYCPGWMCLIDDSDIRIHPRANPWSNAGFIAIQSRIDKVVIEDGVTTIGDAAFYCLNGIETIEFKNPEIITKIGDLAFEGFGGKGVAGEIYLGKNLIDFGRKPFGASLISSYSISNENPNFDVKNGILYSEDGKTLISCPPKKVDSFNSEWLADVEIISEGAFQGCEEVIDGKTIRIPESVSLINTQAFDVSGASFAIDATSISSELEIKNDAIKGNPSVIIYLEDNTKKSIFGNNAFIYCYLNGGSIISQGNGDANVVKEGMILSGWIKSGTTEPILETLTEIGEYTAQWTPATYQIVFNANGGIGNMISQSINSLTNRITLNPNCFEKTGYRFTGWSNTKDGVVLYSNCDTIDSLSESNFDNSVSPYSYTLYANWTVNQYTISFNTDGGSTISPISVNYGEYISATIPTKDGYTFAGWEPELPVTMPANNLEVTAIWTEIPMITEPSGSSVNTGSGKYTQYPRTTSDGGTVDFGTSPVIAEVILPKGSYGKVVLTVDSVDKWPAEEKTPYGFDISVDVLGEDTAYISVDIKLSDLERLEVQPEDVGMYHFVNDEWILLKMTYEIKDDVVRYTAETDSFSPFEIRFVENGASAKAEEEIPVIPDDEPTENSTDSEKVPELPDTPTKVPATPAPILGVIAGLLGAAVLRRK